MTDKKTIDEKAARMAAPYRAQTCGRARRVEEDAY